MGMNRALLPILSFLFISAHVLCQSRLMIPGNYDLCFQLQGEKLHIPLNIISETRWQIRNHEEFMDLTVTRDAANPGNEFVADIPFFRTRLRGSWIMAQQATGHWEDLSRDSSYWVPFHISPSSETGKTQFQKTETLKFKTVFQNSSDTTEALGQFTFCDSHVTGTFMTETGDYRHLHGVMKGNEIQFGTFDGAHLYFFKAILQSDSITDGVFLSGNKWRQPWSAVRDEDFSLRDPNRIVLPSGDVISTLSVTDKNGNGTKLAPTFFQNHVTVIEVMGTWCPNCLDASRYLDTLTNDIQDTALRVMPLLFERGDSFAQWTIAAQKFFSFRDKAPEYFFGGKASKKTAAGLFPALTEIIAFPTLIIIDRQGNIAWVHSGFYGPSAGAYYEKNKKILKRTILQLLR